jgi:hypothetical protein
VAALKWTEIEDCQRLTRRLDRACQSLLTAGTSSRREWPEHEYVPLELARLAVAVREAARELAAHLAYLKKKP